MKTTFSLSGEICAISYFIGDIDLFHVPQFAAARSLECSKRCYDRKRPPARVAFG